MSGNRPRQISPSDSTATRRTAFIVISLSSRKNVASGAVISESKQAADLSQEIVWMIWMVRIAACGTRSRRSSDWLAGMDPRSRITQPGGEVLHPLGARGRKAAIRVRPGGVVLLRKRRIPLCSPRLLALAALSATPGHAYDIFGQTAESGRSSLSARCSRTDVLSACGTTRLIMATMERPLFFVQ